MISMYKFFCLLPLIISVLPKSQKPWADSFMQNEDDILIMPDGPDAICPMGYFQCNSTSQCVIQRMNCDGSADCNDASDEWSCSNEVDAKFWDHLFRKQPYARIDDIPLGVCYWPSDNMSCPCRGNQILCRFQNLTEIPRDLPRDDVDMLDLSGNNFEHLSATFLSNIPMIDELVLKSCEISSIAADAFTRLSVVPLTILYLDDNKIASFNGTLFPKGNVLQNLTLSRNLLTSLHDYDFLNLEKLLELDLRHNRLETFEAKVFEPLANLESLYLNENRLMYVDSNMFPVMKNVHTLSLAQNHIERIERNSFPFPSLEYLFLAGNKLTELPGRTFCDLNLLKGLHLENNMLRKLDLHAFDCLDNLISLLLNGNEFKSLDSRVLGNLTKLDFIYFSWFHLCRAALHVRVCEPHGDGISSAFHLLDNVILRGSVWVIASIAIMGNLLVVLNRFIQKSRSNMEHSLYLGHLAASDFLMGVYLAIIACTDMSYRGKYIMYEESWRHSGLCAFSGFLSTFSCQSSTLLLTLVTWDRLMSVLRPLEARDCGRKRIAVRLFGLWSISFAIAVAPLFPLSYFGSHFYGTNGVCLSLHIHDPYAEGWEYSAILFICINTFSLLFIFISYLRMLQAIRVSGTGIRSTLSGREGVVATRFALIIATDCICWLPVIVVKLSALAGIPISPSLYAWLAVMVLPVNSALNPVLYTLTTSVFRQQLRRYCRELPRVSRLFGLPIESALSSSLGQSGSSKSNAERNRCPQRRLSFV